jgi:uncharacterized protein
VINAAIVGAMRLFSSAALLDGLGDVLERPKLARRLTLRGLTGHELLAEYAKLTVVVSPAQLGAPVSVDPDDDAVLACALAAKAEAIVSSDDDLLRLGSYQGIPILTAPEMLTRITPTASTSP